MRRVVSIVFGGSHAVLHTPFTRSHPLRLASVVVGLALILTGCVSDTRRADAIAAIGNRAIIPNLDAAVTDLENLDRALTRFCDDQRPTTLIEAREAWLEAEQS